MATRTVSENPHITSGISLLPRFSQVVERIDAVTWLAQKKSVSATRISGGVRDAGLCGLQLTDHASARVRQRGISSEVLGCLIQYGRREHDHKGAEVVVHDRESLDDVRRLEPKGLWLAAERARDLYAVIDSSGWVITAGHRNRRVIRDMSLSSMRPCRGRRTMSRGRKIQ